MKKKWIKTSERSNNIHLMIIEEWLFECNKKKINKFKEILKFKKLAIKKKKLLNWKISHKKKHETTILKGT